jgi:hypothetical protein
MLNLLPIDINSKFHNAVMILNIGLQFIFHIQCVIIFMTQSDTTFRLPSYNGLLITAIKPKTKEN